MDMLKYVAFLVFFRSGSLVNPRVNPMNNRWQLAHAGRWMLGIVVGGLFLSSVQTHAAPAESVQFTGRVVSVERKGAATKVVVDKDDGSGTLDIAVTRATNFHSEMKGDTRFFKPGCWVVTTASMMKNEFYADSFDVYIRTKMAPQFQKHPTTNDYNVCGVIVASDQLSVTLQIAPLGNRRILLDSNALDRIKVYLPNADYVEAGSTVDMEGVIRGKKFSPTKVTVRLAKPLSVEQAFSKKRPDAAKTESATKDKDSDKEMPAKGTTKAKNVRGKKGANNPQTPDPFGFNNNNDTGKKPGKK